MKYKLNITSAAIALLSTLGSGYAKPWSIETQEEWNAAVESSEGVVIKKGVALPSEKYGTVLTKIRSFEKKRSAQSLTISQSTLWQNWNSIENLGPSNLQDAPVLLTKGPNDYWIFGRYGSGQPRRKKGEKAEPQPEFTPEEASVEGFGIPLKTTRFANVYDAPGGLKSGKGGYHAWQSRDMKTWVHHGPVTEGFSKWVTSAEYVDGKALIYYDFPNDQDPHVYVDSDLTDGEPGENMGMAVSDPSHGSDAGFIRDLEGKCSRHHRGLESDLRKQALLGFSSRRTCRQSEWN